MQSVEGAFGLVGWWFSMLVASEVVLGVDSLEENQEMRLLANILIVGWKLEMQSDGGVEVVRWKSRRRK